MRHENEHKAQVDRKGGKRIGFMINLLTIKETFNKFFKRRKK